LNRRNILPILIVVSVTIFFSPTGFARIKYPCNEKLETPWTFYGYNQVGYLLNSLIARNFPHEFSVYNVTAGAFANVALLCSSSEIEAKEWYAGSALISLYDLNVDVDNVDKDKLFLNNYILWNILHLSIEGKYLFGSSAKKQINLQLKPTKFGTLINIDIGF